MGLKEKGPTAVSIFLQTVLPTYKLFNPIQKRLVVCKSERRIIRAAPAGTDKNR